MRYLSPSVFLAAALAIEIHNLLRPDRILAMPVLTRLFPALRESPALLGHASAGFFAAFGAGFLVIALLTRRRG